MEKKKKLSTIIFKALIDRAMKKYGKGLPRPKFSDGIVLEYTVPMRDGVKLKTDVFFPAEKGDFPIIFVRSPYCNDFDYYEYVFKNFVKYGFILCFQQCRGRGKSEGVFMPFENERNDGIDTVKWLKEQNWYTHKIVPLGISYLAMNHLLYCDTWDDDFKTAVLSMYGGNVYNLAYVNGMFRDEFFSVWTFANNPIKRVGGDEGFDLYKKTAGIFPRSALMENALGQKLEFFDNIIENPSFEDEIWHNKYFMPDEKRIKIPLCLVTGWYDFTTREVMRIYNSLDKETKNKSALLIGPWTHLMQNNGDKKTPHHYTAGFIGFKYALKWLLNFFYDAKTDIKSGVMYYVINKNSYTHSAGLPSYNVSKYYLGENFTLSKKRRQGKVSYIYDPKTPVATLGGCSAAPALLSSRRRPVQCVAALLNETRDDVLVFKSEKFLYDRTILGGFVNLCVSSSAYDTCFSVKLCAKEGRKTYAFSYGISNIVNNCGKKQEYKPDEKRILRIDLSPVAYKLKNNSKIVLVISSSDYPSFNLSLNSEEKWCHAKNPVKAEQTIYFEKTSLNLYFKK